LYFAWSLLVYFGSTKEHEWWPLFLYPLIYPWGRLFEFVGKGVFDSHFHHPQPVDYMLFDRIMGGLYIVGGTVWLWCVGRFLSFVSGKLRSL
jgi:hypothetical protein